MTLLNVTLIILTLIVSRLLNLRFILSFPTRRSSDLSGRFSADALKATADAVAKYADAMRKERKVPAENLHVVRSEEHTSELQSHVNLVCRLLLEKKKRGS